LFVYAINDYKYESAVICKDQSCVLKHNHYFLKKFENVMLIN